MDEKRECDGHCERCNINQRTYCAAQMAYYNQQEIASIKAILSHSDDSGIQTIIGMTNVDKKTDSESE